ncbi:MAG: pyridoxal phosphate-dependent aminotransferase family protein [Alphaproteobacteria bacterium]|nr:MAG: pyridoxal phosphate-dependent aminotransferase family protein [Alphaproteobacteria bacterium]
MSLLKRFDALIQAHKAVSRCGIDPFGVKLERVLSPTRAIVDGRPVILAGTNNYLGLTFHPDCIAAAAEAARREGTGTTGSRIANGSYALHKTLEERLAGFFERRHAMVFSTGYQANLGIISTIAGPDDYLIIDSDSHASIYDAIRLSSATVIRFKHNDAADLDKRLHRLSGRPGNKVIVVEGIYSMLGDQAPLREIAEIKRRHGAYLVVDEAHSLGVLGEHGRGLGEHAGVEGDIDFVVGTFSKSLGAVGGLCVSDMDDFDVLRVACRPYMFTASLPPSVIASVTTALEVVRTDSSRQQRLWRNVDTLYDGLDLSGFTLGRQKSPVIAVHLPDQETAVRIWYELLEAGVYVNLALPPATPTGTPLLRCSVCADHSRDELETIVEVLRAIAQSHGVIGAPARSVRA